MRKFFRGLLALTTLAIVSISATVVISANDSIRVIANGQEIYFADQEPVVVDGRTLVPVRGVFEAIGFDVDWDDNTSTALLAQRSGVFNVAIQAGAPYFSVAVFNPDVPYGVAPGHAVIIGLDVPAQIIGGRTMLPIRAVLESVGFELDWDEATNTVIITSEGHSEPSPSAPIVNISHFLGRNMNDVTDLLGGQTYFNPEGKWSTYYFDTGLQIGVDGSTMMSIWVDYSQVDNRFHFNQINGESTRDDVKALFGSEPYDISYADSNPSHFASIGAVVSYGFFSDTAAHEFVRFYFNADNTVVAIRFFG